MPSTCMRPASGRIKPDSMRSVVVLPAPFGPSRPVTVPSARAERHVAHRFHVTEVLAQPRIAITAAAPALCSS